MRHRVAKLLHRIGIHVACHVGYEFVPPKIYTLNTETYGGTSREVHS